MGMDHHFNEEEGYDFLEETVFQLEEAWRTQGVAQLDELVVKPDHPLRERLLVELIKVDQEYRWESGERKSLEAYLEEWPELRTGTDSLTELLTAECETRAYLNETTTREELAERFPKFADCIDLNAIAIRAGVRRARNRRKTSFRKSPCDVLTVIVQYGSGRTERSARSGVPAARAGFRF